MKISSNQFSKKNFNKGTGFTDQSFNTCSNSFSKKAFNKGTNVWGGDNTAESAYGVDDIYGGVDSTYGTTPYGGMSHFRLRQFYDLSH